MLEKLKSTILQRKAMQEEAAGMGKERADKDAEAQEEIRTAEVGKAKAETKKVEAEAIKAQAEAKATETESLGKGLENQEKKLNLLDKDEKDAQDPQKGMFDKITTAEGDGKPPQMQTMEGDGKPPEKQLLSEKDQTVKDTIMGGSVDSVPTPTEEEQQALDAQKGASLTQAPQGGVQPASFNQDMGQEQAPPPSPEFTPPSIPQVEETKQSEGDFQTTEFDTSKKDAYEAQLAKSFDEAEELKKDYNAYKEVHQEEYKKQKDKYMETTRQLAKAKEESPSYRQAIRDIPAVSKALALISATLAGAAGQKNPTAVIDQLIERSYADQKAQIDSKIGSLTTEQNLLGKIMEFSKDELQTKNMFKTQAMGEIMTKINFAQKGAHSEKERNEYKKMATDQHNVIENYKQADEDRNAALAQTRADSRWAKQIGLKKLGLDARKVAVQERAKPQGGMTPLEMQQYQKGKSQGKIFIGRDSLDVRDPVIARRLKDELPGKIAMVQKTNKLVSYLNGKADPKSMTKKDREYFQTIQEMKGDPGFLRSLKRLGSGTKVAIGKESRYEQTIDRMYAQLTEIAMAKRTSATGGGPLNDEEKKMLYNIAGVTWKGADKFSPDLVKKGIARSIVSGSFEKVLQENSTDVTKMINQDILINGVISENGRDRGYSKEESRALTGRFISGGM